MSRGARCSCKNPLDYKYKQPNLVGSVPPVAIPTNYCCLTTAVCNRDQLLDFSVPELVWSQSTLITDPEVLQNCAGFTLCSSAGQGWIGMYILMVPCLSKKLFKTSHKNSYIWPTFRDRPCHSDSGSQHGLFVKFY